MFFYGFKKDNNYQIKQFKLNVTVLYYTNKNCFYKTQYKL